jgi:hypothetical protein
MVKELANADSILIIMATFVTSLPANWEKKFAKIIKKGAPGGCPTSNLNAVAINSPQSQKLVVGSMVNVYTVVAIKKTIQPEILLKRLYFFIVKGLYNFI